MAVEVEVVIDIHNHLLLRQLAQVVPAVPVVEVQEDLNLLAQLQPAMEAVAAALEEMVHTVLVSQVLARVETAFEV
jgi:predicted lysophospholipase L1 biosynthesis ABC-type transport system permease subunit